MLGEDFDRPLYELIARASAVRPHLSREEITAVRADAGTARALGVARGAPLLLRRRTIVGRRGTPIEYNLNYYRPDRYTIAMDLR